jgi:hypothetical protein
MLVLPERHKALLHHNVLMISFDQKLHSLHREMVAPTHPKDQLLQGMSLSLRRCSSAPRLAGDRQGPEVEWMSVLHYDNGPMHPTAIRLQPDYEQ